MPTRLSDHHLHTLARYGAQARLNELREEIRAIERAFPELARRSGRGPARQPAAAAAVHEPARRRRKRPAWSAAQRKAAADRMRAYWAKRKSKK